MVNKRFMVNTRLTDYQDLIKNLYSKNILILSTEITRKSKDEQDSIKIVVYKKKGFHKGLNIFRKNLAIERMIVEGCDILLDVNQE